MYCAIGVEPTKPTALMSGSSRIASTASLSPLTTLRMPAGRPASMNSSASRSGTPGSRSDGLRMKALPQAMRRGELPQRDHRREVERRDAGDDAERLAHRVDVDAGAGAFGVLALEQVRDAAGELDDLEAALDVALGVGDGLAVLAREQLGELVVVALHQLQELHQDAGAPLRVGRGPFRLRGTGVLDGGAAPRPWTPAPPWPGPHRSSARRRRPTGPMVPLTSLPPMKCPIERME